MATSAANQEVSVLHLDKLSAEEQERAEYLNEIVQHSTQFGPGNWNYQGTFDFNEGF